MQGPSSKLGSFLPQLGEEDHDDLPVDDCYPASVQTGLNHAGAQGDNDEDSIE